MCEDGQPCKTDGAMEKGLADALKFVADNKRAFDHGFDQAFVTHPGIQGILKSAEAAGNKDRVSASMRAIARAFYEAGALSTLAVQQAKDDLNEVLGGLPPEVQALIQSLGPTAVHVVKVDRGV